MSDIKTPGFDPNKPMRRVRVLKRDISFNDDVIPLPDASWEDGTTYVKALTPFICLESGTYVIVAWDLVHDKPGILIVNHSLFPQLRDWHRDFGQSVVDTTFMIDFWPQKGLSFHRITSMGQAPVLGEGRLVRADAYIDEMFGEAWVEDDAEVRDRGSRESGADE